ncbi:MAG: hypothetical protein A4E64_03221 [Syntrophorhabdus sp. PtaU1.Bin058]|nr:MAG: hypothetical protein A4E64_03221 [Syntrophorhabdus sp. PtaU1.Bin058]
MKTIKYFLLLTILPPCIYVVLTLLRMTLRFKHINRSAVREVWDKGGNFIVCFWHGRLLMMPFAKQGGGGKVLISRHRDGEFIARIIRFFGLGSIRGSYRKEGSVSSLRTILQDLKHNVDVAITPDGPKGPRYKVKQGIIELAKLSGKAIVPVSYGASKKKLFSPGTVLSFPTPFQRSVFSGETRSI